MSEPALVASGAAAASNALNIAVAEALGAIRVASGDIDGLRPKWQRGYGRWVRDVLVWTKAPFLFWNNLVPVDGLAEQRVREPATMPLCREEMQHG